MGKIAKMGGGGQSTKPSFLQKIGKELTRPFRQLAKTLSKTVRSLITAGYGFSAESFNPRQHSTSTASAAVNESAQPAVSSKHLDKLAKVLDRARSDALFFQMYFRRHVKELHQEVFAPYRNAFQGKDVVVIGGGKTQDYFTPLPNAVHIGSNSTFFNPNLTLDFLFLQDWTNVAAFTKEAANYGGQKFIDVPINVKGPNRDVPSWVPMDAVKQLNGKPYYSYGGWEDAIPWFDKKGISMTYDIVNAPPTAIVSGLFSMLQFVFWGNPQRIYLVGFDAANTGHHQWHRTAAKLQANSGEKYDEDFFNRIRPGLLNGWSRVKQFRDKYYPDTEIVSINPVGLKGLFDKDIYTEACPVSIREKAVLYEKERKHDPEINVIEQV